MKKTLFILQILLKWFLLFALSFIWTRYFIRPLWLCIVISAVVTLVIDFVTRRISTRKSLSTNLKLKEREDAENMFLSLATCNKPLDFFARLAARKSPDFEKKGRYILLEHGGKTVIYPFLQFKPLAVDDLTSILAEVKKEGAAKLIIPCNEPSKEVLSFSKNFDLNIIILDKFQSYKELYKSYDVYPDMTTTYKKDKALAFKDLIAYSFNKSRTKGYFLSAIVLFIAGFIVKAQLYYSIVASILIVFALFSQFNSTYNIPKGEIL